MFTRTQQCLTPDAFARLQQSRVLLFGVGGVGGWCAEALVRTGVLHLTIVDFDTVAPSNINRQVVATSANIGLPKVEQMRQRLLSINPDADITVLNCRFSADTARAFRFSDYHFIIDAIDSVPDKLLLAQLATQSSATFFASMGAARRLDPLQVQVAPFNKVHGCPLARAMRQYIRHHSLSLDTRFTCVFSPEPPIPSSPSLPSSPESSPLTTSLSSRPALGSLAPVVATFGMTLASLVIRHCLVPTSPRL